MALTVKTTTPVSRMGSQRAVRETKFVLLEAGKSFGWAVKDCRSGERWNRAAGSAVHAGGRFAVATGLVPGATIVFRGSGGQIE